MTAIILLNWNGWQDTIECLESLYLMSTDNYVIVIVDNASDDDSVNKITDWLRNNKHIFFYKKENEVLTESIKKMDCIVYALNENYGFAKGNNKGIELVRNIGLDYYLLLNNDTTVDAHFLEALVSFQHEHSEFKALMPQIRYYDNPDMIWNCGGKIVAGLYRYSYSNVPFSVIKEKNFIPITFITGCALFACVQLVEDNKLLTERFFFGVEDLDFSIRMKKKSVKMACVLSAKIFHKVNSSLSKLDQEVLGMKYYNYLLYFINTKMHYSKFYFFFWKLCYYPYMFRYLKSLNINKVDIFKLFKFLWVESTHKKIVTREDFIRLRSIGSYTNNKKTVK